MKWFILPLIMLGCGSSSWSDNTKLDFLIQCRHSYEEQKCQCVLAHLQEIYTEEEWYKIKIADQVEQKEVNLYQNVCL